jgi:hypothetical protein
MKSIAFIARCALPLLLLSACAGGLQLSGDGFVLDTRARLEGEAAVEPGVALFVTAEGGQLLGDNAERVARALLEQDGEGPLDLSAPINGYLEGAGLTQGDFTVSDVVLSVELRRGAPQVTFLADPTRVRVELGEVWVRAEGTATQAGGFSTFACRIRGRVDRGTTRQRMFTLRDLAVEVSLAESEGRYDARVEALDFNILESGVDVVADSADPDYYCNLPECQDGCGECHAICGGASVLEGVLNFFAEYLDGLITEGLQRLLDDALFSFARISAELAPDVLLGALLPDLLDAAPLAIEARPSKAGFAVVGAGDLAAQLDLSSGPLPAHPCIGPDPGAPALSAGPPPPTEALGLPRPHAAAGLSVQSLNQLLWGFYRAGGLCLQLSSEDISGLTGGTGLQITAGTLDLVFPGLTRVVGDDAPLLLSLQPRLDPQNPEVIRLGSGLGEGEARESLLRALLPPLELSLHAWVEGRWLRLFAVDAGLELGLTPVLRDDQVIDLSVDRIAVTGLRETYNELFPGQDLGELFQLVVELALGMVAGQGFALPLPLETLLAEALGLPVGLEITDLRPAGDRLDWLLLGARFDLDPAQGAAPVPVQTAAALVPQEPLLPGQPLRVQVAALDLAGAPLEDAEVQWRVDQGPWRGFTSAGEVEVHSHLLQLRGEHTVELRARLRGQWRSLDLTPARLSVQVAPRALAAPEPNPTPAASEEGGCAVIGYSYGRSTPRLWGWLALGLVALGGRRRWLAGLLLLLGWGCGEEKPKAPAPPVVTSCQIDGDCAAGERCGCGACYAPAACDDDADCCGGQRCERGECLLVEVCQGDEGCSPGSSCEGCLCRLPSCTGDRDCASGQACRGGACVLPERFPCATGCDPGEACLGPLQQCVPAPAACAALDCRAGEALVVTNPASLEGPLCAPASAVCACQEALAPVVSGDPTGYLRAAAMPDGRIAIAAYDIALRDLTLRFLPADSATPGPALYLAGHGADTQTVSAGLRGNLGVGPDVGAELDMAVAEDGTIGIVARDKTARSLLFFISADGESWRELVLDPEEGRDPDLEAAPGGGWVVAWQSQAALGGDEVRSALKVATADVTGVFASADFRVATLDAGAVSRPYPALPGGPGATPALARRAGGWALAWFDGPTGALKLATWARDPESAQIVTAISPQTRGGRPGGATGLAPRLLVASDDTLEVAYVDVTSGSLRSARLAVGEDGAVEVLESAEVDAGQAGFPQRSLGLDYALSRGADGGLVLVYQDATQADLYVATGGGAPLTWSARLEDATGSTGFFPQVLHQGQESILIYGRWLFPEIGKIDQRLVVRSLR